MANFARAKEYSMSRALVRFGLSRQSPQDFSQRARKSPCLTPVLRFLNFFVRGFVPKRARYSPGTLLPPKIGAVGYVPKLVISCTVWPEAEKPRIFNGKSAGDKEHTTFRHALAGFA